MTKGKIIKQILGNMRKEQDKALAEIGENLRIRYTKAGLIAHYPNVFDKK